MNKKKIQYFAYFLLFVTLFAAFPKSYLHGLFDHKHSGIVGHSSIGLSSIQADTNTKNCDLNKFESPIYYTFNGFNFEFKQIQRLKDENIFSKYYFFEKFVRYIFQLRAPPIAD